MFGGSADEWSEMRPLGPFPSEKKAREAIREDLLDTLNGCESLSPGDNADWADPYVIVEVKKAFQPKVKAEVSISLGSPVEPQELNQ